MNVARFPIPSPLGAANSARPGLKQSARCANNWGDRRRTINCRMAAYKDPDRAHDSAEHDRVTRFRSPSWVKPAGSGRRQCLGLGGLVFRRASRDCDEAIRPGFPSPLCRRVSRYFNPDSEGVCSRASRRFSGPFPFSLEARHFLQNWTGSRSLLSAICPKPAWPSASTNGRPPSCRLSGSRRECSNCSLGRIPTILAGRQQCAGARRTKSGYGISARFVEVIDPHPRRPSESRHVPKFHVQIADAVRSVLGEPRGTFPATPAPSVERSHAGKE